MIFQLDVKYDGRDKLVRETLDYMDSHKFTIPEKAGINLDGVDDFFLHLIKRYNLGTKITNPRMHFMKPGADHNTGHNHQTDTGVYYLQTPKNCSKLIFPDLGIEIEPHEGLFIVVPAREIHAMTENKSDGIRLALAFNIE